VGGLPASASRLPDRVHFLFPDADADVGKTGLALTKYLPRGNTCQSKVRPSVIFKKITKCVAKLSKKIATESVP